MNTENVTTYVTNPQATGWGATWNGRPVVRLPVTAQTFTGGGAGLTGIPIAGVSGLQTLLDGKLNTNGVTAGNIAAAGGLTNAAAFQPALTNSTTFQSGVYFGTNGVFFTPADGTIRWILV